jgi:prevent-host-death family protein
MSYIESMSASDFKAKCLDVLDRVGDGEMSQVAITKRGRVVAMLVPAVPPTLASLHGFMRGSVVVPEEVDLTDAVCADALSAEDGLLHG